MKNITLAFAVAMTLFTVGCKKKGGDGGAGEAHGVHSARGPRRIRDGPDRDPSGCRPGRPGAWSVRRTDRRATDPEG